MYTSLGYERGLVSGFRIEFFFQDYEYDPCVFWASDEDVEVVLLPTITSVNVWDFIVDFCRFCNVFKLHNYQL